MVYSDLEDGLVIYYCSDLLVLPPHKLPVIRETIDEDQLYRTITVSPEGKVYYINHVLLGIIKKGRFVADRDVYRFFSRREVRKVREYLREQIK